MDKLRVMPSYLKTMNFNCNVKENIFIFTSAMSRHPAVRPPEENRLLLEEVLVRPTGGMHQF